MGFSDIARMDVVYDKSAQYEEKFDPGVPTFKHSTQGWRVAKILGQIKMVVK
jgi:hypothetical protein